MKNLAKTASQIFTGAAATATLFAGKVMALSVRDGVDAVKTDDMPDTLIGDSGLISKITSIILYLVGALSVIMLIYGGFKYATSAGDSKKVTDAKNTILYAIIGLVICLLSYAIVKWVLGIVS